MKHIGSLADPPAYKMELGEILVKISLLEAFGI